MCTCVCMHGEETMHAAVEPHMGVHPLHVCECEAHHQLSRGHIPVWRRRPVDSPVDSSSVRRREVLPTAPKATAFT